MMDTLSEAIGRVGSSGKVCFGVVVRVGCRQGVHSLAGAIFGCSLLQLKLQS